MATMDEILCRDRRGQGAAVERLFELLRIPSVSAVPAHFPDCERAADWLVAELGGLGFEAAKHPTDGRPMVLGHFKCARRDAPHVLFYGHYDVQPADPLELWQLAAVRAEARDRAARRAHRRRAAPPTTRAS